MITDIVSTTGMLLAFVVIFVFGMAGKPVPGEKMPLMEIKGEGADTGTTKSRKRSVHYPS